MKHIRRFMSGFLILAFLPTMGRGQKPADPTPANRALAAAQTAPAPAAAVSSYRRCHALCIGIDDYAEPGIPDLAYAENDARAVAAVLREKFGFQDVQILAGSQATREGITHAVSRLFDKSRVSPADAVLIYYAGHGETVDLPRGGEMGFLVPQDARIDPSRGDNNADAYYASCIPMQRVKEWRDLIPARHVLVVADSCFSGLLAVERAMSVPRPIADSFALEVCQILTAGTRGQRTSELPEKGHGAYTAKMLEALETGAADLNKDGYIRASELGQYLRDCTIPNQTPQSRVMDGEGDFILAARQPRPQVESAGGSVGGELARPAPSDLDRMLGEEEQRKARVEKARKAYERLDSVASEEGVASVEEAKRLADLCDAYIREYGAPTGYQLAEATKKRDWFRAWRPPPPMPRRTATPVPPAPKPAGPEPTSANSVKPGPDFTVDLGGGVSLEMVWVLGGKSPMGSPASETGRRDEDEGPVHEVTLDGFWMGKYEVTQEQYQAVMGTNPSSFKGARNPVEKVSWNDATEFCRKLSDRTGKTFTLPTEAQWERACRARSLGRFCFGDSDGALGEYAWYGSNSGRKTHPVGEKKPNGYGLYDMHGNVWEWCSDWSGEYSSSSQSNPRGPSSGKFRVLRGGSWYVGSQGCRSANRGGHYPTDTGDTNGFRVVRIGRTR